MTSPNRIDKQTMVMDIRQLVSLDEAKSYFLCLNENTWLLVQMLHSFYGSWRNRYSQNVDVATPIQPDDTQWNMVMDIFDKGEMELTQVTCLDDLIAAIDRQTAQISVSSSSSGDCGCVASGDTDVTELGDSEGEEVPQDEEFPPGFDDREEFDEYRCKAAYWIVRNYIATLNNWAGLTGMVGGLTLAVIMGLLLLTVPPVGLMVILAAMGVLVGIDIGLLVNLSTIAGLLEDNIDQIVCDIYNAETTNEARQVLSDAASQAVDDSPTMPNPTIFKSICDNLISNEQMGVLLTQDAVIAALPAEDCSNCVGGCVGLIIADGVLESGDLDTPGSITVSSSSVDWNGNPGDPRHVISIQGDVTCWQITFFATDAPDIQHWAEGSAAGCGSDIGFFADGEPPQETCWNALHMFPDGANFNTPFEVTLTWECC